LPSVKLDDKGVCNYCNSFDRSFSDWDNVKEMKKKQFEQIIEKVKNQNAEYDCLIPLSGGRTAHMHSMFAIRYTTSNACALLLTMGSYRTMQERT
jgi:hypothetical protein